MTAVTVKIADYKDEQHAACLTSLLAAYALDPAGGGEAISDSVLGGLVSQLASRPYAFSMIAFDESGKAVGLANCFEGFSTFAGKGLVNIHDFYVAESHRKQGVSQILLAGVEEEAKRRGACKITLEVLDGNRPAKVSLSLWSRAMHGSHCLLLHTNPPTATQQLCNQVLRRCITNVCAALDEELRIRMVAGILHQVWV
jgi:GNAT superfamily N-acetyltransferase